jgi:hypothetical protein
MTQVVAGRYRLIAQIGSGGTGTVWQAEDMLLQRVVAVKELRMPASISPEQYNDITSRALAEGRVAARLHHPHIVAVYDVVEHDGRPWIIMQHVVGQSLEQALAGGTTLPVARAAQIGVELLEAISAAHAAGVIHRDVKPSNVLIGQDGKVYLTDFSIAKAAGTGTVTNTGVLIGSPGYIAPELIVMGRVAEPADLFGLGATLFRMVEGVGPFDRDEAIAGAFAAAVAAHPRPQRAGALTPVIDGLLAKDPRERLDAATTMAMLTPLASAPPEATAAPAATEPHAATTTADAGGLSGPTGFAMADPVGSGAVGAAGAAKVSSDNAVADGIATGSSGGAAGVGGAVATGMSGGAAGVGGAAAGGWFPSGTGGAAVQGSVPVEGGTDRWRFRAAAAKVSSPTHELPEIGGPRSEPERSRTVPMLAAAAVALVLVTAGIVYALSRPSVPSAAGPQTSPSISDSASPAPSPSAAPTASASPTPPPATQSQTPPKASTAPPISVVNRKSPGCGEKDSRLVWTAAKAGISCSAEGTTVTKTVGWDQQYMQSYAQLRLSLKNQQLPGSYSISFKIGGLSGPEYLSNRGGCGGLAVHTSSNGATYDYFNVCADGWVETVRVVDNVGGDSQQRQLMPGPADGNSPSYSVVVNVNPSATEVTVSNRVGQSVTITAQAAGPSTAYIALITTWRNIGATARFSDFTFSAG